ncbi:CaiB/BaiF CoA transferase family protein [Nocardioides sp. LML1-1-1.1]|uniref:CaiB/BaiF CoA transferase family protein n=1 Tax=Nocardioides sp. LML1-1-1.1 TaxID=3135248 RepID=UPI00341DDC25
MSGPLDGIRVVELAGIGPGPHACMLLGDLGADVVRVERPGDRPGEGPDTSDLALRGRTIVQADLKDHDDLAQVLDLVARADVLIEGFRPGVAERLGLGPEECVARNPGLVYGRMTGFGQSGPRAQMAGHDINYISITGILDSIGPAGHKPVPPLNLVGDFGGGSMFLVVGVLAALVERRTSGRGQVIDAAMVDGASALAQMQWSFRSLGMWQAGRGVNLLDGSHPFYDTYECADGRFMAVGSLEPQFYALLIQGLGIDPSDWGDQWNRSRWASHRAELAARFKAHDRDHWVGVFDGTDACVTPVLSWDEAARDPHLAARGTIVTIDGVDQAAPAPRFSRTRPRVSPRATRVMPTVEAVKRWTR